MGPEWHSSCSHPVENHSRTLLLSARLRRCGRAFDMPDLEEMDGHLVALATKNLVRHQIRFQTCVRSMRFGRAVVPFSDFPTHPSPPHLDHVQPRTWVETFRASEDWDLLAIVGYKGLTVDLASLLDITSTLAANGGLVAVLHGPDKTSFYSAEETAIALDIITTFLRDQAPPGNIAGEEDTIRLQLVQVAFSTALTDLVSNTAPARGTDLAINWVYANVLHSLSTSFAAQTQLIETPDGPDDDFWPRTLPPRMEVFVQDC